MLQSVKPLIIVGGGGHARVLAYTAAAAGISVIGYVAPEQGERPFVPYLGPDSVLDQGQFIQQARLLIGVGSVKPAKQRAELFERFAACGYSFAVLVHPSAVVFSSAKIGAGAQILAGAIIQGDAEIGENVIINTGATVDHDCRIGAHAHIAPGATVCGDVTVGARAHVGAGAVIVQGRTVAEDGFVRAGEVVKSPVSSIQK